jgi:hypothetical protein
MHCLLVNFWGAALAVYSKKTVIPTVVINPKAATIAITLLQRKRCNECLAVLLYSCNL